MNLAEEKMPLGHALLWILFSTLLISGSAFMGWLYFLHLKERRLNDDQYKIVAIIQKSSQKETLKVVYLAELLGLSIDQPINLYQFDVEEGERKLLASPLIKSATIKKIRPGTLFIDYQIRTPTAYLANYSNTAIDEEGVLFPFRPFFTPKKLPYFYFDLNAEMRWGESLAGRRDLNLAFNVMKATRSLRLYQLDTSLIDVSQALLDNFGKRQIVVVLEENDGREEKTFTYLRLNPEHYNQNLENYRTYRQLGEAKVARGKKVIDLRIPQLAFIKQIVEQ